MISCDNLIIPIDALDDTAVGHLDDVAERAVQCRPFRFLDILY